MASTPRLFPGGYHAFPLPAEVPRSAGTDAFPLSIIAHVISYLEDDAVALSRLARASRVLYYMALPFLWKTVTLKSHSTIHYKALSSPDHGDGDMQPEGFGSASPFAMGLQALVSRNVANLVRSLCITGDWVARDQKEYAAAGRISENAMILAIAVGAALARCTGLESFKWDLPNRPLPPIITTLPALPHLTTLYLRFPTARTPHPTSTLPTLPNLRELTITHYDPLSYPDDFTHLLLHATKLSSLQLHFSPLMRETAEPSVSLSHLFRRNIAAKRKLKLKKIGIYNCFAGADGSELMAAIRTRNIEELTSLNTFGADPGHAPLGGTSVLDSSWAKLVDVHMSELKTLRVDQVHHNHVAWLSQSGTALKRLYIVSARYGQDKTERSGSQSASSNQSSPPNNENGSGFLDRSTPTGSSTPGGGKRNLRDLYLDAISNYIGASLQHLLLPSRWLVTRNMMARLIRSCPNLSQVGAALDASQISTLRLLAPFLPKLYAIRLLCPTQAGEEGRASKEAFLQFIDGEDATQHRLLSTELAEADFPKIKYVGLGWKIWEVGGMMEEGKLVEDGGGAGTEETALRRRVSRIDEYKVRDVEIWKMDSLEVV